MNSRKKDDLVFLKSGQYCMWQFKTKSVDVGNEARWESSSYIYVKKNREERYRRQNFVFIWGKAGF